jgi:hypothetical protein
MKSLFSAVVFILILGNFAFAGVPKSSDRKPASGEFSCGFIPFNAARASGDRISEYVTANCDTTKPFSLTYLGKPNAPTDKDDYLMNCCTHK